MAVDAAAARVETTTPLSFFPKSLLIVCNSQNEKEQKVAGGVRDCRSDDDDACESEIEGKKKSHHGFMVSSFENVILLS